MVQQTDVATNRPMVAERPARDEPALSSGATSALPPASTSGRGAGSGGTGSHLAALVVTIFVVAFVLGADGCA